ncbi:unnamed protein product [Polarella glacialis]|uniref:Uncharacterized protein n=1 Tax=Polarella glacialis TaxID=89957 RepID=A0A813ET78_POLGL|nr:unnamed protein product [Polarella glacialis]CAE8682646.1 unnamed protein product [Polarella glacialis]
MAWKSASVITSAKPERVWEVYSALSWQEWDHDIAEVRAEGIGKAAGAIVNGARVVITMVKDRKMHNATFRDVVQNQCFTYIAPLPGSSLIAVHTLEPVAEGTRITHTFDFSGMFGGLYRWLTADWVQKGLDTNTVALKALAEVEPE